MENEKEKTRADENREWDDVNVQLAVYAFVGTLFAVFGVIGSAFVLVGHQLGGSVYVWLVLFVLFPALLFTSFQKPVEERRQMVVLCVFLVIVTFFLLVVCWFFGRSYEKPITLSSPDGRYEVTVREWDAFPYHSGARLSVRKAGRLFPSKTIEVYKGDSVTLISQGNYEMVWDGYGVILRCGADGDGETGS